MYIIFLQYSPPIPFPYVLSLPLVTPPLKEPILTSCPSQQLLKEKRLISDPRFVFEKYETHTEKRKTLSELHCPDGRSGTRIHVFCLLTALGQREMWISHYKF
jgi:hypothetical protein